MQEEILKSQIALTDLCYTLRHFLSSTIDEATYRAPIIDHHHPDDYRQKSISGLRKFLTHAETEREYVTGLVESSDPFTSNAPHILAVWDEFLRAKWPISSVTQVLECGNGEVQAKIDIVAEGGNLWIKVNTIRINRLLSEFREQDSYINSDYDSDSDFDSDAESSTAPSRRARVLTNSVLVQAESILRAARTYPRAPGLPPPRLRYVLNRLEEHPANGYSDPRVAATFHALREMGVELVLSEGARPVPRDIKGTSPREFVPHRDILLDLSIIVALCCDTTHYPLPPDSESLEARFRAYMLTTTGERVLTPHTSITKDLRDQLQWEMDHPLIEEVKDRLKGYDNEEGVRFWVTREVKERVPGIVDVIGGPGERARARALLVESGIGFWRGSRYEGNAGVLRHLKARVLDDDEVALHTGKLDIHGGETKWSFEKGLLATCSLLLRHADPPTQGTSSTPSSRSSTPTPSNHKRRNGRKSRNPNRPTLVFPANSNLPSPHTLRSLMAGVERGMTVLTNNRGAVGKVIREMGVREGIPADDDDSGETRSAAVWVVNPSSLAEWRRIEVEESNQALSQSKPEA